MLIVVVLLITVLMRFAIVTAAVYLLLPAGPLCPHCKIDMVPIKNWFFDRLLPALQRRWCLSCGWNGVVAPLGRGRSVPGKRSPRPILGGPAAGAPRRGII